MSGENDLIDTLYSHTEMDRSVLSDPEVAHLVIDRNNVLGMQTVPGLEVDAREIDQGIDVVINVEEGAIIRRTVHLCFGVVPDSGVQKVVMQVNVGKDARIAILAHCIFPNARDVRHIMDARISLDDGAEYTYWEKHVHSPQGGVKVYPTAVVDLGRGARFKTEFELLKGRVGLIDIDYETTAREESSLEMMARISGKGDDVIKVREVGHLEGAYARGVLTSKIAVRERATAEIHNTLTATAPYARGHVDCKEIVQDDAFATAIPIVEVHHPKAHITHEAAIGSVDTKRLETLMSRGLSEEDAVELIIQGLLS